MMRVFSVAVLIGLTASPLAAQQATPSGAPVADAVRTIMQRLSVALVAAGDDMPVAKFGFRPTPAQLSFGGVLVHSAEFNETVCSWVSGMKPPMEPKPEPSDTTEAGWTTYGPKATAHLKRSFEYCAAALANLDDSKLDEQVPWFGGPNAKASRARDLIVLPMDWQDHYAQLAMYLRMNGILPPSARPKPKTA
jgi:DinB family protein